MNKRCLLKVSNGIGLPIFVNIIIGFFKHFQKIKGNFLVFRHYATILEIKIKFICLLLKKSKREMKKADKI